MTPSLDLASMMFILGGPGNDVIDCGNGDDVVLGGDGDDEIRGGSGNDLLCGEGDDDTLLGDKSRDSLSTGNDTLLGGSGNDDLFGGRGTDYLYGEDGTDVLEGGFDGRIDVLHPGNDNEFDRVVGKYVKENRIPHTRTYMQKRFVTVKGKMQIVATPVKQIYYTTEWIVVEEDQVNGIRRNDSLETEEVE